MTKSRIKKSFFHNSCKLNLILVLFFFQINLYAQVPTIDSFFPTNGPIGTEVVLTGTNFSTTPADNFVFFGATRASVSAASSTELTVTVPDGASYMPISVVVNSLLAYSSAPFIVTFDGAGINTNTFDTKVDFATEDGPNTVTLGDLDGDGKTDMVVANQSYNMLTIYRNNSTSQGTISYENYITFYNIGVNPLSIALGDLDGDGMLDMAVATFNYLRVYLNTSTTGSISFASSLDIYAGISPQSVAIADFDLDGKADLAVVQEQSWSFNDFGLTVFRNLSTGTGELTFSDRIDFTTGAEPHSIAVDDLDGDGKTDIVTANRESNTISVLRNTSPEAGTISFASKQDFATAANPYSVSIGDFDGDNQPDIAVANSADNSISIFRNESSGSGIIGFTTKTDYLTGTFPRSVSIGDMDGDGKVDLSVTNYSDDNVSILKNSSSGAGVILFEEKVDYVTGSGPYGIAIGDLDNDGKSELASANYNSSTISILRNISEENTETDFTSFSFSEQSSPATLDLVNHEINITVLYGTDLSTLVASFSLSFGATATVAAVVQESDITSNDFSSSVTYKVTAEDQITLQDWIINVNVVPPSSETDITSFSFPQQVGAAIIDDMDHTVGITVLNDTDITDLIATFALSIGANAQVASLDQVSATTPNNFSTAVTYTITAQDGATTQDWQVTVAIAPPIPFISSFTPTSGPISTSVTISGSNFGMTPAENIVFFGSTEAVVTSATKNELTVTVPVAASYHPITVNTNSLVASSRVPFEVTFNGQPISANSFDTKADFATGNGPRLVVEGDLDGDGKVDMAVINHLSNTVSILRNTSSAPGVVSFAPKLELNVGADAISVALADFDGDGKKDVAVVTGLSNFVYFFRNLSVAGAISFDSRIDISNGAPGHSIAAEDLDGDGKIDIAIAHYGNNTLSIMKNASTGVNNINFEPKVEFESGTYPIFVSIGDLDNDNLPDIIVSGIESNTLSIYKNNRSGVGTISFDEKVDLTTGNKPWGSAIGDLNGDGKVDLIVSNNQTSSVSVYLNTSPANGTISYADKIEFTTGPSPRKISLGDLDGDGKPDLAVGNFDGRSVSVLKNTSMKNGDITFAPKIDLAAGNQSGSVAIGDLDGDGKPDLTVTNRLSNSVSTFKNITVPRSTETEIISFDLPDEMGFGIIDSDNHTVEIEISFGSNLTAIKAVFSLSEGASAMIGSVVQESGVTVNDFTNPTIYTITAEDQLTTQDWTITVTIAPPNTEAKIIDFYFEGKTAVSVIDPVTETINVEVLYGTNVSSLLAVFSLSYGATAMIGTTEQITGMNTNDFSNPITYTITAEDGVTTKDWLVTVTIELNSATDIIAFSLPEQTEPATIDYMNHSIIIKVESETDITSLTPAIEISDGATVTPASGVTQDFTELVTYTVTAEDGLTSQEWVVTLNVVLGIEDDLLKAGIYPNPVNEALFISLGELSNEEVNILITNLSGQVIHQQYFQEIRLIELDVKNYPPGMYLIYLKQGDKKLASRFLKK